MEYTGGRTESEIVNWILKKVGPASTEVTCDTVQSKVDATKLAVVFFGDLNSAEYTQTFLEAANNAAVSEKFSFFHTSETSCAEKFGAKSTPAVVLFRKFDESPLAFSGTLSSGAVVSWMQDSSVPTLIDFSEDYIEPIFGQRKPAIILFRNQEDANSDFSKVFAEAANKLKGKIIFVVSGIKDGIQHRLADFIGVDDTQVPTLRILHPGENMKKFTYAGSTKSITVDDVTKFVEDFKTGSLKPFLKSAEPPADNSEPVKVVVGKTFRELVTDNDNDVLIKYYAPWCGHCKKIAPIWDQVAADLKDVPNLTIAKFDATANEVEGLDIRGYPTLKFYSAGSKGSPTDYDGERGADDIKAWLKEHSKAYKKYLESKDAKAEL